MPETVLTSDQILEAAEDVLRRFGPAKTTVVDVARALGVSHGSVYRHFPSKAALRDAVTERWLGRVVAPLEAVVADSGSATQRLRRWFDLLITKKRSRAQDDPELFATYVQLVNESREVVKEHVDLLVNQVAKIIADGVKQGEFSVDDPFAVGQAVFYATTRFHNPVHASEWSDPNIETAFEGVWLLLLGGLTAGAAKK